MLSLKRVSTSTDQLREAVQSAQSSKSVNGRVRVKIIEPGQGATGYYTPDVLTQAGQAGVFDNAPIMWNHPGDQLRSEKGPDSTKTAGFIEPGSAKYEKNGPKGEGLYGVATILKSDRDKVGSWVDTPFGLSIHASGELERPGDITSRVLRIDKVHSVDLVVRPGAGGSIVEVLESELTSLTTWNSYPLETSHILHPIMESEDMLISVREEMNAPRRGREHIYSGNPKHDNPEQRITRNAFRRVRGKPSIKEDEPMLTLQYQLYEDDSSGNQYLLLGNENEQGFEEAAEAIWSSAMGELQEDDEEPQVFKDSAGNHFALVGNKNDIEEATTMGMMGKRSSSGRQQPGTPTSTVKGQGTHWAGGQGPSLSQANARTRGTVAGRRGLGAAVRGAGRAAGFLKRNKGAAAAAVGAGATGVAAGRASKRSESEEEGLVTGEVIEQDGQFFQYLGTENPLQEMGHYNGKRGRRMETEEEDDGEMTESENAIMEELKALRSEMQAMRETPEREQAVAEAANEAAVGADASRRLIQEAALEWAQTPEEAKIIGAVIGNIIEAEREAMTQEYGLNRVRHWDGEQPSQQPQPQLQESYVGGAGAFASGGGNLQEADMSKFDANLDKLLEGVL